MVRSVEVLRGFGACGEVGRPSVCATSDGRFWVIFHGRTNCGLAVWVSNQFSLPCNNYKYHCCGFCRFCFIIISCCCYCWKIWTVSKVSNVAILLCVVSLSVSIAANVAAAATVPTISKVCRSQSLCLLGVKLSVEHKTKVQCNQMKMKKEANNQQPIKQQPLALLRCLQLPFYSKATHTHTNNSNNNHLIKLWMW